MDTDVIHSVLLVFRTGVRPMPGTLYNSWVHFTMHRPLQPPPASNHAMPESDAMRPSMPMPQLRALLHDGHLPDLFVPCRQVPGELLEYFQLLVL